MYQKHLLLYGKSNGKIENSCVGFFKQENCYNKMVPIKLLQ